MVTLLSSQLSLSPQTVLSVPLEAKTDKLCSGIFLKESTCIPLPTVKLKSAPFLSHQTDTGCVLLADPPSRSGIWKAKLYLTNSSRRLSKTPTPTSQNNLNVCHLHGALMARYACFTYAFQLQNI